MYKKIAKKFILVTFLFIMIIAGATAPVVDFNTVPIAEAEIGTRVAPKKTAEVPIEGDDGTKSNSCNTCFVAVKGLTI